MRADDGRIGGDEFTGLLRDVREEQIAATCTELVASLAEPFEVDGILVQIGVSVGAVPVCGAADATEIIRQADIALYHAKNSGRGRATLFGPELLESWEREAAMLDRARHILAHERPCPWYQPKIALDSGAIVGFEALLRCPTADGKVIMPG